MTNISGQTNFNKQYYQGLQPSFTADGKPISTGANTVVQNNPILNAATNAPDNPLITLGAAGASAAALMGVTNYINNPLVTKDYSNTFFQKIETWGDKLGQKPFLQKTSKTMRNTYAWFKKNVVRKSEVLKTLWTKNSIGRNFAQQQAAGTRGHLATRALEVMKKYKEANPGFTGFDAIIKRAEKESFKYYDDIIKAIKTSGADLTQVITKKPKWGLGLVTNKSSLREILNKDILINNYKGAKTSLGKKLSGYTMRAAEALTNGVFSGKGAVLLQALFIAMSANEASKAEKGEKFSAFMASFTELLAFMATMSLQVKAINKSAALKYIGMSAKDVAKYQKAVRIGNEAAKLGNAKAYEKMAQVIKQLKANASTNIKWYQKPIKWIGNIVGWARPKETLMPLNKGTFFSKIARGFTKFKSGIGFVGRMAIVMAVVTPIIAGVAKKISHTIFGKPVKTIEKEKAAEKAAEEQAQAEQMKQLEELMKQHQMAQSQQQYPQQQYPPQPAGDLLTRMQQQRNGIQQPQQPVAQQYPQQPIGAQTMQQPIASTSMNQTPEQVAGIKRSYIPNTTLGVENPVNITNSRSAAIDAVLRQADWAEAQASKYL